MATLEAIRGGGGSIRVGTIGTISSLMTRELESSKSASSRRTSDIVKPRKSTDEASSSSSSSSGLSTEVRKTKGSQKSNRVLSLSVTSLKRPKQKTPFEDLGNNSTVRQSSSGKMRSHRSSSKIPMLGSENVHLEKTPSRDPSMKRGLNIVDIVDVNCGNPSISDRLKKLGFSKLSQSFM
ncbi:hypothetical protein RND81_12G200400 [Saponaria officinalis]|uniref:Uncharacterized protein n=1 Tax=Saponaria officinalis TaxID=3572 RepID=A0AAW1HCX6_SAPOF